MAARAMGTGTVSFGLVAIPVKLYSTTQSGATVSFRQIDKVTGAPVKQKLVSSKDGRDVPREDIVKGYEIAKDQFVILTDEEIDSAAVEATKSIDIQEFLPIDKIDPVYFDKPYFLGPDKGGARPYRLIQTAMREAGLCALAQYATRGKQYLVMIRATEEGLIMQQLHYHDEVRPWSDVPLEADVELKDAEVALARQIIAMSTSDAFHPEKYEDTVRHKLLDIIRQKTEGQTITVETADEPAAQVIDLMEALKASLALGDKGPRRAPGEAGEAKAAVK